MPISVASLSQIYKVPWNCWRLHSMSEQATTPEHTVERECRPLGGHVRLFHVPTNPAPFIVLADFPGAPENATKATVTKSFIAAHKAYESYRSLILAGVGGA
jgi:hypothetical protein